MAPIQFRTLSDEDIVINDLSQSDAEQEVSHLQVVANSITGSASLSNAVEGSTDTSSCIAVLRPYAVRTYSHCDLRVRQNKVGKTDMYCRPRISLYGSLYIPNVAA